ncbi:MAG: M20 aminoacylase family protein [Parvibaculaceae bacterium]
MDVPGVIAELLPELIAIRHDLHANPETGFEENRTGGIIAGFLASCGIEVHRGIGKTGVVGVLEGRTGGGRRIGLRADMDALPMQEEAESPYRSVVPGKFHGCGHDGHMATLLGAARYLARTRTFSGTVHFVFQPAEEGLGGARAMLKDGLLERFPCDEIYGFHNWPELDLGKIRVIPGPCMAGADFFDIRLKGKGSHAAMPHNSRDPVTAMASLIGQLQTVVSRSVDPLEAAVLSVTRVAGGTAYNVIPSEVRIGGTVRFFSEEVRFLVLSQMRRIVEGCAASHAVDAELSTRNIFDVTVNDETSAAAVAEAAAAVLGNDNVIRTGRPSTASEDFADMLKIVPGAYFMIGHGKKQPLHHPQYEFDDAAIPIGAGILSRLVENRLPA